MTEPLYSVGTWDGDKQSYTPEYLSVPAFNITLAQLGRRCANCGSVAIRPIVVAGGTGRGTTTIRLCWSKERTANTGRKSDAAGGGMSRLLACVRPEWTENGRWKVAKSLPGHGVVCRASDALRRLRLYFLAARQSTGVAGVEEAYPVKAGGVYPNRHWTDDARDVVFGIIGSPGRLDYVPDGSPAPPAVPVAVQNQMRVGELIEALLQYDPGQEILTQAVMPDGSVFYAVPIKLFEVIGSVGGAGGRPYVGLSVRVPHADRGG